MQVSELEGVHHCTGAVQTRQQLYAARRQLKALDYDRAEYALLSTNQRYYEGGTKLGNS